MCALVVGVLASTPAAAGEPLPAQFDGVDIIDKLGQAVDLDVPLVDHTGRAVRFADFFDGKRPVIVTLNYFRCESLCSAQLNELVKTLKELDWAPGGEEFRIVTVSFDPRDDAEIARGKRDTYLRELARQRGVAEGVPTDDAAVAARAATEDWAFLTATPEAIRTLTERLGYAYRYDADTEQYAHAPVVYIMSPTGVISRYLYGITYASRDLKFALIDASEGNVGSLGEKILMSCFSFDESAGGYTAFAWGFMRLGAILVLLVLGPWLLIHWRRERRARTTLAPPTPTTPVV